MHVLTRTARPARPYLRAQGVACMARVVALTGAEKKRTRAGLWGMAGEHLVRVR